MKLPLWVRLLVIEALSSVALILGYHPTEFLCDELPQAVRDVLEIECHCSDCDGGEAPEELP